MLMPVRQSLVKQAADALRRGICRGYWRGRLPGERELAAHLTVSRPTLRHALAMLQRDGWIGPPCRGRRRAILKKNAAGQPAVGGTVALLCDGAMHRMLFRVRATVDELRHVLHKHGLNLDVRAYPQVAPGLMERALADLTREQPASAWILTRAPPGIQRWFAGSSLPVLINGACYPEVSLPSVGIDYHAVGRHAAGVFLQGGHRCMAMISTTACPAGDLEAARGFLSVAGEDAARILRFDGSQKGLTRLLRDMFAESHPPTAVLCAYATHAVMMLGFAHRQGWSVPGDLSLIARVDEPVLQWTVPIIAHYRMDVDAQVRKLARLTVALIRAGHLPAKSYRMLPEFVSGGTVAAAPRE